MKTDRREFPMRTLFLHETLFFPYNKLDNGKFPWEDIAFTAHKIQEILQKNGVVHSAREPMRVRFSRKVADLIGGKKIAKTFLQEAFGALKEQHPSSPDCIDIEMSAPQK